MNVRFSDRALRIRVSRAEFEQLLSNRAVTLDLALPHDHSFRVSVRSGAVGGWQLDSDPTGLWLSIPHAELTALAAALPSKEGVTHTFTTHGAEAQLAFEVDVKKPRGSAQAVST